MATLVQAGSVAAVTAAGSITPTITGATSGNILVAQIVWSLDVLVVPQTPTTPTGWTVAYAPASTDGTVSGGLPVAVAWYYQTATAGSNSAVLNCPGGGSHLYSQALITEWSGMGVYDSAGGTANVSNNHAPSTTGVTIPNTGTLAAGSSTVFTSIAVGGNAGLNPANIAFSGGSWNTLESQQDTGSTVGSLMGYKLVATNAALGAVYTWSSDPTMASYQGAVIVFSDGGGGGPVVHPYMMLGMGG